MKLREAMGTMGFSKKKQATHQLYTQWGENLDPDSLLNEYPRPQLKRDNYLILNGYWDYSITKSNQKPEKFTGKIVVPFSPESVLSEVNRQLLPSEYLWYEKVLPINKVEDGKRCILHFGAVDQSCEVFINHTKIIEHTGGYLPFSLDITDQIVEGDNYLTLKVTDSSDTSYHSRGKQKLNNGGMFYTAQSGIWQTVWMEWVPNTYIEALRITPSVDRKEVEFTIILKEAYKEEKDTEITIDILADQKVVKTVTSVQTKVIIPLEELILWSPETPFLYDLLITAGHDRVESYFAMRKYEIKKDRSGIARIFLNNQPYFQNGLLDQGYWPDGLYTAPSDEAMIFDIQKAKELGFNMLRKHIKIEPLRWYYHCDRIGMIVWQDMVNGGGKYNMAVLGYFPTLLPKFTGWVKDNCYRLFSRENKEGRQEWISECEKTVEHLYNCPSIAVWVPFNEGWGQFDAKEATSLIRSLDKTRLIDHASGWFDQQVGDFKSIHNYFRKLEVKPEERAFVLSEFGGYACYITKHSYSNHIYGYRKYNNRKALNAAIKKLYRNEICSSIEKGLSAAVFTQLSDVEDEVNGLFTYDRKVCKITKIDVPFQ